MKTNKLPYSGTPGFFADNTVKETELAISQMTKHQKSASERIEALQQRISMLEKNLEKPYIVNKEQPYYLHAIICHDGMANNGHFYTYMYDRIQKIWFKLDDHKSEIVDEADVMKEAQGDSQGYKSAFLLFYVSKQIVQHIQKNVTPVYKPEFAQKITISQELRQNIKMDNYQFELEQQNFYFNQIVEKIVLLTKERTSKLEAQEENLGSIVTLKLYSFAHFLRIIEFKGFAKWIVLNQTLKEEHPENMTLEQISHQRNRPEEGGTPQPDEIYQGLLNHYAEKFMYLTKGESESLRQKMNQFKCLQKKAIMVIFLFNNVTNMSEIKRVINVFMLFKQFNDSLLQQFGKSSFKRIYDYEHMAYEVIQILVLILICNMYGKYRSSKDFKRRDAQLSATLAASLLFQFCDKKHVYLQQYL